MYELPPNLNSPIILFRPLGTKPPNLKIANISGYTVYSVSIVYIKITSPCSCTFFTTAATLNLQNTKSLTLGEKLCFLSYNYALVWVGVIL